MHPESYSLAEVLAVADIHPFYNSEVQYPPQPDAIQHARESATKTATEVNLHTRPMVTKKDLYKVIKRLTHDTSPGNVYRLNSYISITGGGSGGLPLMFATDVKENRRHRSVFGDFMAACRLVDPGDWVLTTHASGYLYRSLDLTTELFENAGATVLSCGNYMTPAEVFQYLAHYHVNVLTGDGSQIIQLIHLISMLPVEQRQRLKLTKIIYTSEPLTQAQREHIIKTLGPIKIFSILGSAESGPYAIGSPDLTGQQECTSTVDFVFDTRTMLIEIFPSSIMEEPSPLSARPVPNGEPGIIVQTSLQRLRNPVVRYNTGDIGSVHALPERARDIIAQEDWEHLRVLRLHGRDRRFSFKWFAVYFEFENVATLMQAEGTGILQWQVILDTLKSSPQTTLEVRILRAIDREGLQSKEALVKKIRLFFNLLPENEHLFQITFVDDIGGFEKSGTGTKVMKFVDRTH